MKRAERAATIMSPAIARLKPPPAATPLTATTVRTHFRPARPGARVARMPPRATLHGKFAKSEPPAEEPVRPVFPKRSVRSAPPERLAEAAPAQPPFRQERLEPLLNTIKQD